MNKFSLTLSGLLLATTALVAPGLAAAQSAPTAPAAGQAASSAPATASDVPAPQPGEVDAVIVRGRFIPEPMKTTSEVASYLSPEEIQRTGDSTAAEALTRVTGLSIAEGRFVYVRGLGERYSSAMLNGSPLPSPEPLQRVVPLDLFPSNILGGVAVQKTFSVNYPGEFGGGVIDLTTVDVPDEPFFNFKLGLGGNTETTAKEGLIYYGSRTDWTGFDNGLRDVPDRLAEAWGTGKQVLTGPNFDSDDIERIGDSLVNAPLRLLQRDTNPANVGVEAVGGASRETAIGAVGLILVGAYDNGWSRRQGFQEEGQIDAGVLQPRTSYAFQSNQNDIRLNFLGGLSWRGDGHEVKWTNLYVRSTTKEARSREGFNTLAGTVLRDDFTEWFVRELASTQLAGEHSFLDDSLDLNWRVAYAKTSRDAPYESRYGYGINAAGDYIHNIDATQISFSELNDDLVSGGIDLIYRLPFADGREAIFSGGLATSDNSRDSQRRDLRFTAPNGLSDDQLTARVDYLYSDLNIHPGSLVLEEIAGTSGAGAYEANLKVNAAYLQIEADVLPFIRATGGVRFEDATQSVTPRSLFGAATPFAPTEIEKQYYLPAVTATWNFAEDLQLRLGASKSIGRPQFRELAPQQYTDPETDRTFVGNPYLVDTEILNLDARTEWYFERGQYVTGGVFFKELTNPVESSVIDQGAAIIQSFLNAPKAQLIGFEVDGKKYFDFPEAGWGFIARKRWLVQANYTYSKSEVQVEAGDTVRTTTGLGLPEPADFYIVDGSRLQGQSEHVANMQFGWEDEDARSQATVVLNYVSERTTARGASGLPDLIQDPGVTVDFVYRRDFDAWGKEFGFSFEARNLLGTDYDEYQELGNKVRVNAYDLGSSISLGLTARF